MGPFQEYEEKKSPEKGSPRSRIPRLVLHPFQPKEKGSPPSDSPLSEEEGLSSDHSKRTISTNSFCSDDTGCPTSQSVSPSKTPAGSDRSPHASPPPLASSPQPPNHRTKGKRVRMMAERNPERALSPRNKREQRPSTRPRGSEADFSSSSSAGSLKTRELLRHSSTAPGKKSSSRRTGTHIRSLPVFKPVGSPSANRDAELYAPYRTPPKAPPSSSTNSSCNNSPSSRRASLGRYHSCGDNHGVHPPNPEQYLTPLQQKEVAIRHLKSKLRESDNAVHDRESEIEDLKGQLGRMREDWIEEECHRVEAQLSLKEARREIKQLRQVVETMKGSLMEKDKGIQRYFVDINIQNRKLESLLHSMEMAQSGSGGGSTLDICDDGGPPSPEDHQTPSPDRNFGPGEEEKRGGGGLLETGAGVFEEEDQGGEEMADSGLLMLASDELGGSRAADALELEVLMSTAMETSEVGGARLGAAGMSTLLLHSGGEEEEEEEEEKREEKITPLNRPATTTTIITTTRLCPGSPPPPPVATPKEKGVQTELLSIPPELKALLLQLLKLPAGDALLPTSGGPLGAHAPAPAPVLCCLEPREPPAGTQVQKPSRFMQELDFSAREGEEEVEEESRRAPGAGAVGERHWSSSFLVDLVAMAAPMLPTAAWLYSRHGVDGGGAPVYNIGALMRGCCVVGLRSLRRTADK